jgi:hypothetical protein
VTIILRDILKGEGMKKLVPMVAFSLAVVFGGSTLVMAADEMAPMAAPAPAGDSVAAPAAEAAPAKPVKASHKTKKKHHKHKKTEKKAAATAAPAEGGVPK